MMNPPVNALSRDLARAMQEAWSHLDADRIVITGSGKMFVAGADIREIERITKRELPPDMSYLNELLNRIESSGKLVVMAMNGGALGIGLELAMAGHYRIAASSSQLGLPEVKLGLIPGAGGTQRLPRLAGLEAAMRMCVTGEVIEANEALRLGIVDELAVGNVVERALQIEKGRRTDQILCSGIADAGKWREIAAPRQRSPLRVIEAICAAAASGSFEAGLAVESQQFREALLDSQARAMVHLFFAEREIGKVPMLAKHVAPASLEDVRVVDREIEIEACGKCRLRISPTENGARVMEVRYEAGMKPETLAAALQYAKHQGKLAVVVQGNQWIGKTDLDAATGTRYLAEGRVLRESDIDVLMVRGYGYPEELGGPMHAYSTTPSQISESLREPLK